LQVDEVMEMTDTERLDRMISELRDGLPSWTAAPLDDKIHLLRTLRHRLGEEADAMVAAANAAQGFAQDQPWNGHQWWAIYPAPGQVVATEHVLKRVAAGKRPVRKRAVHTRDDGRVVVDVFPPGATDWVFFAPWHYQAQVWLRPGTSAHEVLEGAAREYRGAGFPDAEVVAVLAAGNTSSGPFLDTLHVLYQQGSVALVKLNPVNAYLLPSFQRIFADFVERGWLRFVTGGADVGEYIVHHPRIDRLRMTGSAAVHDAIVWGTGEQGERNRAAGTPRVDKPFASELGGVNPWIIVPGPWSHADVMHQADRIVGAKLFNCGHTCAAPQILIVPDDWEQGDDLVQEVRRLLAESPPNPPYYPGADASIARVTADQPRCEALQAGGRRVLIPDADPSVDCSLFCDEVFADALGVVRLPGPSVEEYLAEATGFANERLAGDLCATLTIDPKTRRRNSAALDAALVDLRYGAVGVNEWGGLNAGLGTTTWGGYPGNTAQSIGSGVGVIGNAFMLKDVEKSVLTAGFRSMVKPAVAASHRALEGVLRGMILTRAEDDPRHLLQALVGAVRG
jgi:hypothetical protein